MCVLRLYINERARERLVSPYPYNETDSDAQVKTIGIVIDSSSKKNGASELEQGAWKSFPNSDAKWNWENETSKFMAGWG